MDGNYTDRTERGHLVGVYNYHENTLNNRRLGRIPSLVCLGLRWFPAMSNFLESREAYRVDLTPRMMNTKSISQVQGLSESFT